MPPEAISVCFGPNLRGGRYAGSGLTAATVQGRAPAGREP